MLRLIPKNQEKRQVPPELASLGLPDRLLELLLDRQIDTPEKIERYLHPKREDLHDPMLMQDMGKAVAVIRDAIEKHEEITVFGDYDVDGVTATAILLTYLRKQGAQVDFYIPDRHGEGYGLNIAAVEQIASHSKLLITVDCGITCAAEVARAKELGMRVIVTDHHQLGPQMPECEAVLNPLLGDYPFRRLCGAGVAFKLVQAIGGTEAIEPLWELAALATIADIVPLMDENRVIVSYGLAAMAATQRPGLIALMESAGVDPQKVTSADVAFRMAPRINAGGRLALASRGVQLLTTRRMDTAKEIAEELNQDNIRRRELEIDIFKQADEMTRQQIDFMNERAIVVCGEGWNPGVIGLAASRLVEKYKWPTVLLAQDGDICVGSARSIPGVNIHDAMSTCRDLFVRFGGHAQAAGLTIEAKNVPEFRRRLSEAIRAQAAPEAGPDMSMLSEAEQQAVRAFAEQIDLTDANQVIQYGAAAQKNIADFSESALEKVKTKDMGELGDMVASLLVELKTCDEPEKKKGLAGLFQKAEISAETMRAKYAVAEVNVDRISGELEKHQLKLMKDVAVMDQMYEKNLS